jgi:hypothetical protein
VLRIASFLAALCLAGCGGSDTTPASTPLAGTVESKMFTAKSAVALTGMSPSTKFVVIRDSKASCSDGSAIQKGVLIVTVETPWMDGATTAVGTDAKVTFDDLPDSVLAISGEVEVVHAPMTIGERGAIRLLADAGDGASKVDGQVDVTLCQ